MMFLKRLNDSVVVNFIFMLPSLKCQKIAESIFLAYQFILMTVLKIVTAILLVPTVMYVQLLEGSVRASPT